MDLGAVVADAAGWQLVQHYGSVEDEVRAVEESSGICDISGRSAARVKAFDIDRVFGTLTPEIGSVAEDGDRIIARLTDEEALVLGPPMANGEWNGGVEQSGEPTRYVTDVTSGLTGLKIAGPRAREVIGSLTDVNVGESSMQDRSCSQVGFAQIHGILIRLNLGTAPAYELYVAREFGVYVWEVVIDSLGHGGVVPFGNETLVQLGHKY